MMRIAGACRRLVKQRKILLTPIHQRWSRRPADSEKAELVILESFSSLVRDEVLKVATAKKTELGIPTRRRLVNL